MGRGILEEGFETIATVDTHDTILREPHIKRIAAEIAKRLDVHPYV
jgi:hypothetical protein